MKSSTLLVTCLLVPSVVAGGVYLEQHRRDVPTPPVAKPDTIDVEVDEPPPQRRTGAPISLTSSDGTGMKLVSVRAESQVEGPLAFTELHLTFENPEARVREGTFTIDLPSSAEVSRFAMKIGGKWQEGEFVEKQAARVAYEDFLHRKQDPALLEQGPGNTFSARVFPIPARGRKELILTYSEVLPGNAAYRLPLQGLPEVGALSVRVHTPRGKALTHEFSRENFTPADDYTVSDKGVVAGLTAGDLRVLSVRVKAEVAETPVGNMVVLVDTSASRSAGFLEQSELVAQTLDALGGATATGGIDVDVIAFDQTAASVYSGPAKGFRSGGLSHLRERRPLGASSLEVALAEAARTNGKATRLLLITDGVVTFGEKDPRKLGEKMSALRDTKFERADVVAAGGIREKETLSALVNALAKPGVVIDGAEGGARIAKRLGRTVIPASDVDVAGAAWVYPRKATGLQSGDSLLVYAQLPKNVSETKVTVGAQTFTPKLAEAPAELVERAWAKAKIADLTASGAVPEDLKAQAIELSKRYRVLSPYTSLLVLETDHDYARFNIDREANVNVLGFQNGNLVRLNSKRRWEEDEEAEKKWTGASKGKTAAADSKEEEGSFEEARRERTGGSQAAPAAAAPPAMRPSEPSPEPRGAAQDRAAAPRIVGGVGSLNGTHGALERGEIPGTDLGASEGMGAVGPGLAGIGGSGTGAGGGGSAEGLGHGPRRPSSPAPAATMAPTVPSSGYASRPMPRRWDDGPTQFGDELRERAQEKPQTAPLSASFEGRYLHVREALVAKDVIGAVRQAEAWIDAKPGDVLAYVALGEAREAQQDCAGAARSYGSLIDLFSFRADLRRFAGERLDHVRVSCTESSAKATEVAEVEALALDNYRAARDDRPDHPASHRLYAMALARAGKWEAAFVALEDGLSRNYPSSRFLGVKRILADDLGLIAEGWKKADLNRAKEIDDRLHKAGGNAEKGASTRFVLNWETDANDVDFHIFDNRGNHAYYGNMHLASGGDLYADVTTGYGPECFTIRGTPTASYTLQAHYFSRGPMGYGMGKLEVITHDGKGNLTFEERPFVIQKDRAFVDLGTYSPNAKPILARTK